MIPLRVLDLFSGVGGFSLGLERAGLITVAFCEKDRYCRAVLAKRWPGIRIYADVKRLTAARLARDGIAADVICGGFPCQDLSTAGKGAGLAGDRSGLWREYLRLIGELRPRYAIMENVAALLARGLGEILGELAALGYDAEWHCIPASAMGAPHRRDRIWIIACPAADPFGDALWHELWGKRGEGRTQPPQPGDDGAAAPLADAVRGGREGSGVGRSVCAAEQLRPPEVHHADRAGLSLPVADQPPGSDRIQRGRESAVAGGRPAESGICGMADGLPAGLDADLNPWAAGEWPGVERTQPGGVPDRVPRLKALGNSLVPQIAQLIGRAILAREA